jgi:beta-xylosidase
MTLTATPVIPGFFPDPSVCRVGDDYYLASSSFEYFPGVPIHHSRDLTHWTLVANALDRPEQLPLAGARASAGIYAPTLRHHDGLFWLVTTNVSTEGHVIYTARDPRGPWSDPVAVDDALGIDPDLAWDGEGNCWLTYSELGSGTFEPVSGRIKQVRIDPRSGRALEEPRELWSGTGLQFPEAPHLYEIDGTWYLLIAEGGTGPGHAVSVARGPSPSGPFEGCPANPILSHRSTDHPVQNTGHADLVQAPDGSWWMVLLGIRRGGAMPEVHVLGRETFLAPVQWVDGWPVVARLPMEGPRADPPQRDDFEAPRLGPEWISVRTRPADTVSLTERSGFLTLHARNGSIDSTEPAFVGRRQQHLGFTVRAAVDAADGRGGLAIRMDEQHYYAIEAGGGEVRCHARIGPFSRTTGIRPVKGRAVLRIDAVPEGAAHGPDVLRLGIEEQGELMAITELDGRYLSTEVAGGFTGRVIGMYAAEGTVAFDWFEYEGADPR